VRAIEICLTSGKPASVQRSEWKSVAGAADSGWPRSAIVATTGIYVFRDREELNERINRRVDAMFEEGVIEEVRAAGAMSTTASQVIGLHEIRELLAGKMSILQCVAAIQQGTRRYAKRQLTWFRRQTNFQPLNLSLLTHNEAVKWISQRLKALGVTQGND
jgi:tRNA dimethylallyltransferase